MPRKMLSAAAYLSGTPMESTNWMMAEHSQGKLMALNYGETVARLATPTAA
jgi:hypothetical protein